MCVFTFIPAFIIAESAEVNFDTGKAVIKPESYGALDIVGKKLLEKYSINPKIIIKISGFTDSRGSAAYNKDLSAKRADAVKNYFLRTISIPSANIQTSGFGPEKPIDTDKTETGYAKNRRVEIEFEGEKIILSSSQPTATVVPDVLPQPTAVPTQAPAPVQEKNDRKKMIGFTLVSGIGSPTGSLSVKGESNLTHVAGRVGGLALLENGFGFTAEGGVYRLFNGGVFVSDFGQFALGAVYEPFETQVRPFIGLKGMIAKSSMKNNSYIPGVCAELGAKYFAWDFAAVTASAEYIILSDSLGSINLNLGFEFYSERDEKWGTVFNKK